MTQLHHHVWRALIALLHEQPALHTPPARITIHEGRPATAPTARGTTATTRR